MYSFFKNIVIVALKIFLYPVKKLTLIFLKRYKYIILFRGSLSLGDNIILTGIIKQLWALTSDKIILFTNFPEIFENNNKIAKIYNLKKKKFLYLFLKLIEGEEIYEMNKKFDGYKDALDFLREEKENIKKSYKKKHLAEFISGRLSKKLKFTNFKNEIIFSEDEKNKYKKKFHELLKTKFSIINPHSKSNFSPNKGWGFDNYQKLVDISEYKWCQIGEKSDEKLKNVIHFLDLNLREQFYLISKSDFVISNEGYLNHIASSFDKKIYILKPGIIPNEYFKYKNTVSIERDPPIDCSPCYLKTPCFRKKKFCMTDITPEKVNHYLLQK